MRSDSDQNVDRRKPSDAEKGTGSGDATIPLGADLFALLVDSRGVIRAANTNLVRGIGLGMEALVGRSLSKMPTVLDLFPDQVLKDIEDAVCADEQMRLHQQSDASGQAMIIPLLSAGNEVRTIVLLAKPSLGTPEEPLSESAERLFDLVKNIPQGVFYKDRDSVYRACNHAYAQDLGTTPHAIAGRTEHDFHPPALAKRFLEQDKRIIASGATECTEAIHFEREEERLVYKVKSPVRDAGGEVVGVLGILWDITDKNRTENHLRRIVELQTNSLDLFAHSIRDPLTVIQGYLSILQRTERQDLSAEQINMIRSIAESANQMVHITETFLDADRIEETAWSLHTTLVSLDNLVQRVVERFADEALRKGLAITVQAESQVCVTGDEELLMEALSNLLSNAIRYSDRGTITASLHRTVDEAIVSIADEGRGIPQEDLPHIFRKFYRIAHRDSHVNGLGLGLALAKSIVESHGGSITATPRSGYGTTFEIRLPLQGHSGPPAATIPSPDPASPHKP